MIESIQRSFERLLGYDLFEVVIELCIIAILVYVVYRFIRGTRAAGAFKGVLVVLLVATLGVRIIDNVGVLPRISALYDKFLGLVALGLLVTFQPELRRALIRLGEAPFFRSQQDAQRPVVDAVVQSAEFLSKNKFGAIIAIERSIGLRDAIETGKLLNADVSSHLLNAIFWPSSPLHDMGVIIRQGRVLAASVQFPLAEPGDMHDHHLGTRHRAAVGLTKVTDALVVVVSEETGTISLGEHGKLTRKLSPADLDRELTNRLAKTPMQPDDDDELTHLADQNAISAAESDAALVGSDGTTETKARSTPEGHRSQDSSHADG